MKKRVVSSVKVLLILFCILLTFSTAFSHSEEENVVDESEYRIDYKYIFPYFYFQKGDFIAGIAVSLFWLGLPIGLYNLIIMLLGRVVEEKK